MGDINPLLSITAMLPEEALVEFLKIVMKKYSENPCHAIFKELVFACSLIVHKDIVDHEGGGLQGIMKIEEEVKKMTSAYELLNPKKQ